MTPSMVKKIESYIPKKKEKPKRKPLQVRLDPDLKDEVNRYRIKNQLTWNAILNACLQQYRDETVRKG